MVLPVSGNTAGWSPDPHTDTDVPLVLLSLFLGLLSTPNLGCKDRGWLPNLYPQPLHSRSMLLVPGPPCPFSHCHMRSHLIFASCQVAKTDKQAPSPVLWLYPPCSPFRSSPVLSPVSTSKLSCPGLLSNSQPGSCPAPTTTRGFPLESLSEP